MDASQCTPSLPLFFCGQHRNTPTAAAFVFIFLLRIAMFLGDMCTGTTDHQHRSAEAYTSSSKWACIRRRCAILQLVHHIVGKKLDKCPVLHVLEFKAFGLLSAFSAKRALTCKGAGGTGSRNWNACLEGVPFWLRDVHTTRLAWPCEAKLTQVGATLGRTVRLSCLLILCLKTQGHVTAS